MTQLSDDCFAFGGALMSLEDVRRLIGERVATVAGVAEVLLAGADGRILAADLAAPVDLPPFDNAAVDGYAVRHIDLEPAGRTVLPVVGRLAAGAAAGPAAPGAAMRIFTGAPMPAGLDTVFMQEDVVAADGQVSLPPGLKAGANRRLAGEDVRKGGRALPAGRRLGPGEVALIAALGLPAVPVRAPLRVALFSTGDEIVSPGTARPAAALYDANRFLLAALLARLGCVVDDLGILPDRREAVAAALAAAAPRHDLILTSGGVSTGEEDHVKAAVEGAGTLTFWRVAIKPGRPVAMGVVRGTAFVGLPGNPVAAFVTFVQVARPLIARLAGETFVPPQPLPVTADFDLAKKEGRREYVRVRLVADDEGRVLARKHPREGAGVVTSLTETDGLVELPEEQTRLVRGETVGFLPFACLI